MADTYDEIDPSAKYLKRSGDRISNVTVAVGAPSIYDNAKPISMQNVDLENINPDLKERIALAQADWLANKELNPKGEALPITSGRRTREQQYKEYKARLSGATNTGFMAINPDDPQQKDKQFFHEDAVDILPAVPDTFLSNYGLHRPFGSKDPVHVQINPNIEWKNPGVSLAMDDDVDPSSKYLQRQGIYNPSVRQVMNSQLSGLRNDLTSSKYYTETLPKQAVALADVAAETIPGAVKFVGEPFAKLIDKLGDTKIATEALDKVTSFASRPFGKSFGITQDPAYNAEATNRIMDYVGKNVDKGADYISKETGMSKSDAAWFINAAMIVAAPYAARGAKKGYEMGKEVANEAVIKGKEVAGNAKEALQNRFESLRPQEDLAGRSVGAAEIPKAQMRKLQAAELPFPIDLEKSQLTRHPADVRFARETTKDPVFGQQFQEMYAEQNALIQRNLDQFIKDTGAEYTQAQPSTVGGMLRNEIKDAKKAAKTLKDEAYTKARENGEMSELIDATPLKDYVGGLEAEAINANVIASAEIKLKNLINENGEISLNNIEEIRKMVGRLSKDSAANAYYGKEINALIDNLTEGKGGNLYKDARAKNTAYMNEFQDTPVMQIILNTKRGTKQHTTAVANLVDEVMIKSSAEDVTNLFNTLSKRGDVGQKLINELRGAVAQRIKDQATKGVTKDINGNYYVETKALDTIINQLDKSDKLDLLFGKKGAEQYRTINDVTKDLQTIPKETTNPSGSSSSILAAVGAMGAEAAANAAISGGYFPVPIATGGALIGKHLYGKKVAKEKMNKISDFINYSKELP